MTPPPLGGVLVTGGAGFIGRKLSQLASDRSSRWVALDSMNPRVHESPTRPPTLAPSAELIVGDITDSAVWDAVLADWCPSTVIHLAAETDTGLSLDYPTRFTHVNTDGTAQMLEALARNSSVPEQIIVASSRAVYGEGGWMDESTGQIAPRSQRTREQLAAEHWDFEGASPVASTAGVTWERPTNVYGVTKYAQEGLLDAWCGARDVRLTSLRLQNVYGPGQSLINPYTGILALFVRTAAAGRAIPVFEDGAMMRDFVHIDDVARAFVNAIDSEHASTLILDIGTGDAQPVLATAQLFSRLLDAPEPVITGQFRDGDIRHAWCATEAARRELNWTSEISWQNGIADYVEWYTNL